MDNEDVFRRLNDWLMGQALVKGLGGRAALLVAHAASKRQEGLSEAQWRAELFTHAAYVGAILEALAHDVDRLRAAGLWPWPEDAGKPDAGTVQPLCTPGQEQELRRLLEGIGGPDLGP